MLINYIKEKNIFNMICIEFKCVKSIFKSIFSAYKLH